MAIKLGQNHGHNNLEHDQIFKNIQFATSTRELDNYCDKLNK